MEARQRPVPSVYAMDGAKAHGCTSEQYMSARDPIIHISDHCIMYRHCPRIQGGCIGSK